MNQLVPITVCGTLIAAADKACIALTLATLSPSNPAASHSGPGG